MKRSGQGSVIKDGKTLRCGYTTGSCATGAAKAAALILQGEDLEEVEIDTPAGIVLRLPVVVHGNGTTYVECSVKKDAGDDPDATHGINIHALVSKRRDGKINITGGTGIGRIIKRGIFGQVGDYAINRVPREMIQRELTKISGSGYDVVITAPEGIEIGKKTFNENIGIEGGISIIGTTGIVEPMSEKALLDTIYLELDQIFMEHGTRKLLLVLGNHGEKMARAISLDAPCVKISNYIGDSLQYAVNRGFKSITILGHIGKLSKMSMGVFNTHSRVSDIRMEAFSYHLALMGVPLEFIRGLQACLTAEEAVHKCVDSGYGKVVQRMERAAEEKARIYVKNGNLDIKVIMYSMGRGVDLC